VYCFTYTSSIYRSYVPGRDLGRGKCLLPGRFDTRALGWLLGSPVFSSNSHGSFMPSSSGPSTLIVTTYPSHHGALE